MKKKLCYAFITLLILSTVLFAGCSQQTDLTEYVSEYRSNIYIGTQDKYTVFVTCGTREYPYCADGTPANKSELFDVVLTVPDNTRTYKINFTLNEKNYEAELAFDNVRMIHTYSQTLPQPKETSISFTISDADDPEAEKINVTAESVIKETLLGLKDLLSCAQKENKQLFSSFTSHKKFNGEIYVRLLWENDICYYYVGLIDKNGKTYALLVDAKSGKTIATHESEDTI